MSMQIREATPTLLGEPFSEKPPFTFPKARTSLLTAALAAASVFGQTVVQRFVNFGLRDAIGPGLRVAAIVVAGLFLLWLTQRPAVTLKFHPITTLALGLHVLLGLTGSILNNGSLAFALGDGFKPTITMLAVAVGYAVVPGRTSKATDLVVLAALYGFYVDVALLARYSWVITTKGFLDRGGGGDLLAFGLGLALLLQPNRQQRRLGIAITGVSGLAALLSLERGRWLAFAVAALVVGLFNSRVLVKRTLTSLAAVAAVVIALSALSLDLTQLTGQVENRVTQLSARGVEDSSVRARLDEVRAGLEATAVAPHASVTGVGFGALIDTEDGRVHQIHNFTLAAFVRSGWLGMIAVTSWSLYLVAAAVRSLAKSRSVLAVTCAATAIELLFQSVFSAVLFGSIPIGVALGITMRSERLRSAT